MCISLYRSISSQSQKEFERNLVMSKENIKRVEPALSTHSSSSIHRVDNIEPDSTAERCRKRSILRDSHDQSRDDRRVSFRDVVNVRTFPIEESDESKKDVTKNESIDDIDALTEDVYNKLSLKKKDGRLPSLDDICDTMKAHNHDVPGPSGLQHSATKGNPQSNVQHSSDTSVQTSSKRQSTDEEDYAEMDLFMRINYPKYYHFLKSHTITGAVGSSEYRCQEEEFRDAILSCRQYPAEFFTDLEQSLTYYEKIASGSHNT